LSIAQKAGHGFYSLLSRNIMSKIIGIFAMIFLANKLSNKDFGIVAVTDVLINLISVFGTVGLSDFLTAYRSDDKKEIFQSAFWLNNIVSIAIILVVMLIAPFWAQKNADPRIFWLALMNCGIFLLSQLQLIPRSIFAQEMDFKKLTKIQNPFILLIPIAKVIAAVSGWGIYSLALPTLLLLPIQTFWMYRAVKWNFSFNFKRSYWAQIYKFIKPLLLGVLVSRVVDQFDVLILGPGLGLYPVLGAYKIALDLSNLVVSNITTVTAGVFSAALPNYQTAQKMGDVYLKTIRSICFFIIPFLFLMLVAAHPIFHFLYKYKFDNAILAFQLLIPAAILRAITSNFGTVYNSMHQPQVGLKLTMIQAPLQLAAAYAGALIGSKISDFASLYFLTAFSISIRLIIYFFWIKIFLVFISNTWTNFWQSIRCGVSAGALASILTLPFILISFSRLSIRVNAIMQLLVCGLAYLFIIYIILRFLFRNEIAHVSQFLTRVHPLSAKFFNQVFYINSK
jgi:teichuronic acid exporter